MLTWVKARKGEEGVQWYVISEMMMSDGGCVKVVL
jgi:hypothetical protein